MLWAQGVEAGDAGHELSAVLVVEVLFELLSKLSKIGQRFGARNVKKRVEKFGPQVNIPPPEKKNWFQVRNKKIQVLFWCYRHHLSIASLVWFYLWKMEFDKTFEYCAAQMLLIPFLLLDFQHRNYLFCHQLLKSNSKQEKAWLLLKNVLIKPILSTSLSKKNWCKISQFNEFMKKNRFENRFTS